MKWKVGQIVPLVFALTFAAILLYYAPFQSVATSTSSQVVYAPIFDPPMIDLVAGKLDVFRLIMELAFVAFVAGAIFFAASQNNKKD